MQSLSGAGDQTDRHFESLVRFGLMLCEGYDIGYGGISIERKLRRVVTGIGRVDMASEQSAGGALAGLTTKQCEVLDLLIQHKTSKEISRLLGISPHTVDQRILLARGKLQVGTRSETAQAYRRLLAKQEKTSDPDIYQRSIYGSPDMAGAAEWGQALDREATDNHDLTKLAAAPDWTETSPQQRAGSASGSAVQAYVHVLPEAFDGQGGTFLRLGAIVVITVLTTLMILGGMAMYTELAHMLDG